MDFGLGAMIWNFLKSTLESKIDTIDSNVDDINTNIDQSLSTTESNIRGTDDDTLKTLSDQIDTTEYKIDTIDSNVDTINSNIDQSLSTTESNIRGTDNDTLKTLSDQLDTVDSNVDTINTKVDTIDSNVDTINSNIDQSLSTTESNIRGIDNDTLKTLSDQIDNIDITSAIEAEYTADGDISQGDLVGVTEDGKAATVTPDYTIPAPPSSWTSGGGSGSRVRMCLVDDAKVAVVYQSGSTVYLRAGDIQSDGTINWGTAQDTGSSVGASDDQVAICKCGADKIAIAHTDGTNGIVRVCTLSGTTFTIGSATTFSSGDDPYYVDICSPDTDVIVVVWRKKPSEGPAYGQAICATISGTTPTFGSAVNATQNGKGHIAVCPMDTDRAYVSAVEDYSYNYVSGQLVTISGNTLSLTTEYVLTEGEGNGFTLSLGIRMCQYDTKKAVVVVKQNESPYTSYLIVLHNSSGTYVAKKVYAFNDINFQGNYCDCVAIDATHIVVFTTRDDVKLLYCELSGTDIVSYYIYDWNIDDDKYDISIDMDSNSNLIVITNTYYMTAKVMEIQPTTYDTEPTKFAGFLGVAKENITDGNTGTIGVRGVFTNIKTGMDPAKVYVQGDNAYEFVNTAYKREASGNIFAVPLAPNVLLIADVRNLIRDVDATPCMVEGSTNSVDFYSTVINITGRGYLTGIAQVTELGSADVYLRIVIDGTVVFEGEAGRIITGYDTTHRKFGVIPMNYRFNSSLLVQHKVGSTGSTVYTTVCYQVGF